MTRGSKAAADPAGDFTPEARDQIESIKAYIALQSSPEVAHSFVARIVDRCERIGGLPFGGMPRDDLEPGLRSVPFKRAATIFYRVGDDQVRIAGVIYRGRNLTAHFG